MTDAEFDALVDESLAYMHRVIEECNREWDFHSYQRFDIDLDRRVLVFSDGPRPPIECDIQVVGVYMTNRDFWRWSWDNPSLEPALRTELEKVRAFGEANGVREITLGGWPAQDEEAAWAMTALAAKLVGAKSVYRAPDEPRHVFLLVTGVRWAPRR
jgi:hypothetical protein